MKSREFNLVNAISELDRINKRITDIRSGNDAETNIIAANLGKSIDKTKIENDIANILNDLL